MMRDAYQAPQNRQDEKKTYQSVDGFWSIPAPLHQSEEMTYNFTGLGGKVRAIMGARPDMPDDERRELAYTTMRLAFEHIMSRVILALEKDVELLANPPQSLVISGGVASNAFLRTIATSTLQARGFGNVTVTVPKPRWCTDNAAMVAWAGSKMYEAGWTTDKSFLPQGEWPIEEIIAGVDCWLRNGVAASPDTASKAAAPQEDKARLPDKSEGQDPPLPSMADRREAKAESVKSPEEKSSEIKPKSGENEPSGKPDPALSSSQDGQHAPDSKGPRSLIEKPAFGTLPWRAAERLERLKNSPLAPTKRTKAEVQLRRVSSRREKPAADPVWKLNAAMKRLLGPMARPAAAPLTNPEAFSSGISDFTHPGDGRIAKLGPDKRPAEPRDRPPRVLKAVEGARREPEEAGRTAKVVPRAVAEKGRAVESDPVSKPQHSTTDKPRRTPSTIAPGEKKMANDGAKRVPLRGGEVKKEGEVKIEEEEGKREKRVVRLLPPASADNQAPEGSLQTGLNRLKRWIGL